MKKFISLIAIATVLSISAPLNIHAQGNAAATAAKPPPPTPTLEQRVGTLEAYVNNGDPSAVLKVGPKDKDGNPTIPEGLATPTSATSGPGHNAWMMASAAL